MKKQHFSLIIPITFLFFGFLLGFLTGKNYDRTPVTVTVSAAMQTAPTEFQTQAPAEVVFPIDLNRAGKEEILALPEIGETLTLRIMAYRREQGGFRSLSDLKNVEGIDEALFEIIQDLIYVGG